MISIIIPFYNEADNLKELYLLLLKELNKIKESYEIIMVDDGSTDAWRRNFQFPISNFQVVSHRRRLGKGKALSDGFRASKGDKIVFMDADLQDDPREIRHFIAKLDRYDLVNGWRKKRHDPIAKILPSSIFNLFILKLFLKSKFHDINCGYKGLKREILQEIPLYGDNYRFLPLLADQAGYNTAEIEVTHNKRIHGKSKYSVIRLFFGLLDTFTTYYIYKFSERPLHFFGAIGGFLFLIGFVTALILSYQRIFYGILLYRRPALLLAVLLIIVGIQIIMTGVIGELIVYLNQKQNISKK